MFNKNVLVIIEVNVPGKAPDIRYVTIGGSDTAISNIEYKATAISVFREAQTYPPGTTFVAHDVLVFTSIAQYILFLQNQLSDYLASLNP